MGMIGGHR